MTRLRALLEHVRRGRASGGALIACCAALVTLALLSGCDGDSAGSPDGGTKAKAKAKDAGHAEGDGHAHGGEGHTDGEGEGEHAHDHGAGHADEVVLTPEAVRAAGIRIAKANPQKLVETFVATAYVTFNSERMAHVGSVLTGRVAELKVRIGDPVKKGDPLLVIDSNELGEAQSEFIQRRSAVGTAEAAVKIAQENYAGAKELHEKSQGIAPFELRKYQGELQTAEGALASAKASVVAAQNRLQLLGLSQQAIDALAKAGKIDPKYVVHAPIDGQVVEREVTQGELVGPEKERLMTIADLSLIWVVANVPEAKLPLVVVGSSVELSGPGFGNETFTGKVSFVEPRLDPRTRSGGVRVEVENPDAKLRPGMFVSAQIRAGAAGEDVEVLAISEEAVQTVEGEPAVFVPVEGEPNTFAKREVAVGTPVGGMVQVMAGLKPGERYVAGGSFVLKAELGKAGAAHEH